MSGQAPKTAGGRWGVGIPARIRIAGVLLVSGLGVLCVFSPGIAVNLTQLGSLVALSLTLIVLVEYARDTKAIAESARTQAVTAIGQANEARLTAMMDRLMRLEDRFEGERMCSFRMAAAKSLQVGRFEDGQAVLDFFEMIGFYTRRNALDLEAVWVSFSWWERRYFEAMAPLIEKRRKRDATLWCDLVWLDSGIQAMQKKKNSGQAELLSEENIADFLENEATLAAVPDYIRANKARGREKVTGSEDAG